MKTIVPFSKEINLDTTIHEITSISLEHEIHMKENILCGDFIVSGDYKTHALSINKDPFTYRLPFEVELGDNIDSNTVNFDIVDFNYELIKDEALKVSIEFSVEADENHEEIEDYVEDAEEREENVEKVEEERMAEKLNEEIDLFTEKVEVNESIEDMIEVDELNTPERLDPEMENEIIKNVVSGEEQYVTYHVHIVRESETIESICANYDVNIDLVKQYNDITDVLVGDKLLIPNEVND